MSDAPLARWIARAWALLIASSALYFLADNEADNDLWMHLFTGRLILSSGAAPRVDGFSYTAAGMPWIDHEWLTQSAFAVVFATLGAPGLWLVKLAIGLATVWLVWLQVRSHSVSIWACGAAMVVTIAAMARGYAIRPQIITYLGVAALFTLLDRWTDAARRPPTATLLAATFLAFAVWANSHGGFIVGIGIVVLFAATPARFGGPSLPWPIRLGLPLAAIVGACVTPYGPALFTYITAELQAPHPLSEWQPIQLAGHLPALALMAIMAATLKFGRLLRRRAWWAVALVALAAMALRYQRNAPLFAIAAAAPLADQLDGALAHFAQRTRFRLSTVSVAVLAIALIALAAVQLRTLAMQIGAARGGIVYAADEYPVGALQFVRAHALSGNLAVPLDWGGYALWHVAPTVKVSLDGRFATVYPTDVIEDNFAFYSGAATGDTTALLDRYDTTLALVPHGLPTALPYRVGWHLVYHDDVADLFARHAGSGRADGATERGWLQFP